MAKLSSRSRLIRRLEKQSRKNLFFSVLGIVIFSFLIIRFGIPILINFSLFIAGSKSSNLPAKRSTGNFLTAPILNSQFTATNSANITISGNSTPETNIEIYHDEKLIDKIQSDKNGNFLFKITLNPGKNQIKVKAKKDKDESDYSNTLIVDYNKTPPKLEIKFPSDGQVFPKYQESVIVSGATDENVRITVNGFWAIIDENENFTYELKLNEGENLIKIEALDQFGNKTAKEIKVIRSQ